MNIYSFIFTGTLNVSLDINNINVIHLCKYPITRVRNLNLKFKCMCIM